MVSAKSSCRDITCESVPGSLPPFIFFVGARGEPGNEARASLSKQQTADLLASFPGHSQILSRSRGEKSGEGLGAILRHGPEMVDSVST